MLKVKSVEGCCAKLSLLGTEMTFAAQAPIEGLGSEAVLGVRPEFLPIRDNGSLSGTIYSTLPTGMETTVKAECGGAMLTSVVFGSVDYAIDTEVKLEIVGDGIVLFDKESGNSVGVGSVSRG